MPPGNNVDSEYKLRVEGAGIGDVKFRPDHHDHYDHQHDHHDHHDHQHDQLIILRRRGNYLRERDTPRVLTTIPFHLHIDEQGCLRRGSGYPVNYQSFN